MRHALRPFWTLLLLSVGWLWAQQFELKGRVTDARSEALVGASVHLEGTRFGALTDDEGRFAMKVELPNPDGATLVVSMMGFKTQRVPVNASTREVEVNLSEADLLLEETVVSASRVEENILQSPVTIEKLTAQELRESPSTNVYDAVTTLKGVDYMSSSLTFKSLNARGFNSPANARFVQRLDGMDMQTPGLNVPIGALNGTTDLDVQSVEFVPGAASALYGPNALNGILNVSTKNPWDFPGVSASLRVGANHLDGKDNPVSPLFEAVTRVAVPFNKKWALKLNLSYLTAQDWQANNPTDVADYTGTTNLEYAPPGPGNAGYDGLTLYGDEVTAIITENYFRSPTEDFTQPPAVYTTNNLVPDSLKFTIRPTRVARTPYREQDLLDYGTYSLKGDVGLYFRPKEGLELSLTSRMSRGTSVLQSDNRISLNNFVFHAHKLELSGKRFFLRAYAALEDAGDSYDTRFAAFNVNRQAKSDTAWFAQYNVAYFGILRALNFALFGNNLQGVPATVYDDAAARAFADGDNTALGQQMADVLAGIPPGDPNVDALRGFTSLLNGSPRIQPDSPEFRAALENVKKDPDFNTGAKFTDRSSFYHAEGQYDLTDLVPWAELLVGGNFRLFRLNSEGIIFADTAGPILVSEYGAYLQATRRFFSERVRLTASARMDKSQNFAATFTPRVAATFSLGQFKQHNIRISYQTGFRVPELRHQYVLLNVGPFKVIGGLNSFFESNGLFTTVNGEANVPNAFTLTSAQAYREDLANPDPSLLKRLPMEEIRPERVQNVELGYKAFLTRQILVDLNGYFSRFFNFIGSIDFVGPRPERVNTLREEVLPQDVLVDSVQYFRRYVNANDAVDSRGFAAGITYILTRQFMLTGNYSYTELLTTTADEEFGLRTEFNTPKHKVNLALVGRNLLAGKRVGFALNLRWQDAFLFQYGSVSGTVPAYSNLDAQLSYRMRSLKTLLKLGGTNVLNQRRVEMVGGPSVGALVYLQVTYDGLLN